MKAKFCELQVCDPRGLGHEMRVCFWLNVLNASVLAWILLADKMPGQKGNMFPMNTWIGLLQRSRVDICGQLLSLVEIEHRMLRAHSSQPSGMVSSVMRVFSGATQADPGQLDEMALQHPATEVNFGIAIPIRTGLPPLRVYRPEIVKIQLLLNCAHYLNASVKIDQARARVWLPIQFRYYARDFGSSPAEILEFAHATLVAVPSAVEGLERMSGHQTSQADLALVEASRTLAKQLAEVCDFPKTCQASLRHLDFDWAFEFPGLDGRPVGCPELEEVRTNHAVAGISQFTRSVQAAPDAAATATFVG